MTARREPLEELSDAWRSMKAAEASLARLMDRLRTRDGLTWVDMARADGVPSPVALAEWRKRRSAGRGPGGVVKNTRKKAPAS